MSLPENSRPADLPPSPILLAALELCSDAVAIFSDPGEDLAWCNAAFAALGAEAYGEQASAQEASPEGFLRQLLSAATATAPADQQQGEAGVVDHPKLGALRLTRKRVRSEATNWQVLSVERIATPGLVDAAQASLDVVTGLPDRRSLEQELRRRFSNPAISFALFFVDLDGFKQVNDSRGHLAGDRILREVAQRFHKALRDHDFVARYGGDEFVVLIDGIDYELAAVPILRRLEAAAAQPLGVDLLGEGEPVCLSASIGVALSSERHPTPDAMLHAADRGMYAHKRSGQ